MSINKNEINVSSYILFPGNSKHFIISEKTTKRNIKLCLYLKK